MSGACLMLGAALLHLSGAGFTLSWTHSVEKTGWRESWAVTPAGLQLTEAAVQGSGAGMEPGEGAKLQGDWWVWTPDLPPVPELLLGASGATVGGWTLCDGSACQVLGAESGAPIRLAPCATGAG
jgi:hypothetical protein